MVKIPTYQEWVQQKSSGGASNISSSVSIDASVDEEQKRFQDMVRSAQTQTDANKIISAWDKTHSNKLFENKSLSPTEQISIEESNQKKEATAKSKSEALTLVDEILKRDTGAITGVKNQFKKVTGEYQYTKSLVDQLKSKLSLEARSLLKGSGNISDIEVQMLTDSVAALGTDKNGNYNLSNIDFKNELLKIRGALSGEKIPSGSMEQSSSSPQMQDLMDILGGISQTPRLALELSPPKGLINSLQGNPLQQGELGRQMVGGIADEYNQLAGEPLKGGNFVGRAAERAINKPFSTVLDILPFLKGGKTAQLAATTDKATAATKIAETVAKTSEVAKAGDLAAQATKIAETAGQKLAARMNANLFEIAKAKGTRGLNAIDIGKNIIKYGLKARSMEELGEIAKSVTGDTGIVNTIKREAIGAMGDAPVALESVQKTLYNQARQIPGISEAKARQMSRTPIKSGVSGSSTLGKTNALDAFSVEQKLESLASDFYRESLQTGSAVSKWTYKAYRAAADDIRMVLDNQTKIYPIESLKTPEIMAQLEKISPVLADEVRVAKTVSDLRKIESPFVALSRAVEETAKGTGRIMRNQGAQGYSRLGGTVIGSTMGVLPAILGYFVSPIAEPIIEAGVNAARVPLTTAAAGMVSKIGSGGNMLQNVLQSGGNAARGAASGMKSTGNTANLLRLLGLGSNSANLSGQ